MNVWAKCYVSYLMVVFFAMTTGACAATAKASAKSGGETSGAKAVASSAEQKAAASPVQKKEPTKPTTPPVKPEFTPSDPNFAWVTVNGVALTEGRIKALIEREFVGDTLGATRQWVDLSLAASEARRRGIDKTAEGQFILQFFENYCLKLMIEHELSKAIGQPNMAEALADYESDKQKYWRPLVASIKRITIADKELAEKVAAEARKPGANYDRLVRTYGSSSDKARPDIIRRISANTIKKNFGEDKLEVFNNAPKGEILGPYLGLNGYEILKILKIEKEHVVPFEEIKDRVRGDLQYNRNRAAQKKMMAEARAKSKIEKSPQLKELEAYAEAMSKIEPSEEELRRDGR